MALHFDFSPLAIDFRPMRTRRLTGTFRRTSRSEKEIQTSVETVAGYFDPETSRNGQREQFRVKMRCDTVKRGTTGTLVVWEQGVGLFDKQVLFFHPWKSIKGYNATLDEKVNLCTHVFCPMAKVEKVVMYTMSSEADRLRFKRVCDVITQLPAPVLGEEETDDIIAGLAAFMMKDDTDRMPSTDALVKALRPKSSEVEDVDAMPTTEAIVRATTKSSPQTNRIAATGLLQVSHVEELIALGTLVGRGGFSQVYRAFDARIFGTTVAVKRLNTDVDLSVELQAHLLHPNIALLLGYSFAPIPALIFEFAPFGSLDDVLACNRKANQLLNPALVRSFASQIAAALQFVAVSGGLVHRDITTRNALLFPSGIVKLTDFGLARMHNNSAGGQTSNIVGSVVVMAPEAFDGNFTPACDVYALAITIWILSTNRLPWKDVPPLSVMRKVDAGERPDLSNVADELLRPLLKEMWSSNPLARLEIRTVAEQLQKLTRALPATKQLIRELEDRIAP